MENIMELSSLAFRGDALERLSSRLHESRTATKRGLENALPVSIAGLAEHASSEGRAEELLSTLKHGNYPHVAADEVPRVVADPIATDRVVESGSGFLTRLFGPKVSALIDAVAHQSGLSRSAASTLLGLATPLVLDAVGKEARSRDLDARGLSRFLSDQEHQVSGWLPASFSSSLGTGHERAGERLAESAREGRAGIRETGQEARERWGGWGERAHDTRERWGERAHEARERWGDKARDVQHRAEGAMAGARGRVGEWVDEHRHQRTYETDRPYDARARGAGEWRARGPFVTHERRHSTGLGWLLVGLAVLGAIALLAFAFRRAQSPVSAPNLDTRAPEVAVPGAPERPEMGAPGTPERPEVGAPGMAERPEVGVPSVPEMKGPDVEAPQMAAPGEPGEMAAPGAAGVTTLSGSAEPLKTYLSGDEATPKRFVLHGLTFATGSSFVSSNAMLDEVAETLKGTSAKVRIEGHTDYQGTGENNQELSEARASAVKRYLVSKGVPADRISTAGFSENKPLTTNDTAQGRAENRRVELVVVER